MQLRRMLPWVCAAAVVLGACSPNDSGDPARQGTTPSPANASDRQDHKQPKPVPFSLRLAPDMPPATQEAVRAFLAFAANPRASTGAEVPFASPLLLRVNDARGTLQHSDAREPSAWFMSDGEGTTSALFVISNSIANSQNDGVEFLASPRAVPLCNLSQNGPGDVEEESIYITLEPRRGCAEGFRIRLDVDSSAIIRAVELAVRAP